MDGRQSHGSGHPLARRDVGPTLVYVGAMLDVVHGRREAIRAVAASHHARTISVFGSVARGEDGPASDIDFLVEFEPGASLLDLMAIEDELEALLGRAVDVVSVGGLKLRDEHIRREAIPV